MPLHLLVGWVLVALCGKVFSYIDESNPLSYAEVRDDYFSHFDQQIVFPKDLYGNEDPLPLPYSQAYSRPKRSLDKENTRKEFVFKGFDEHFHLELKPEVELLAPGFKVYHLNNGVPHKVDHGIQGVGNCLYRGKLRHQHHSTVALNLCGGMSGLIKTEAAEYLIEPASKDPKDENAAAQAHILKRRSIEKPKKTKQRYNQNSQTHFCGKKRRYMPHKPRRKDHWLPDEFLSSIQKNTIPNRSKRWAKEDPRRHRTGRHKRSVETLVVADREMVRKHGTENVTTYLLTVFNMVSLLYQDSSIGNNISVILVGLVLLEGDEPGLALSHNAESSLSSFCQWQSTIHTSSGRQHDHAVLVTGLDICSWKNEPCDTLGYAPISGMCSKYRSCTVNEDSGLALAFTVAHEIGHNFGMLHDGQGSSPCRKGRGTIMSASLSGLDTSVLWSECSRRDLAHFLQ